MARRLPYQQTPPAVAPQASEKDNDTLETQEGGLQITLARYRFRSPARSAGATSPRSCAGATGVIP